MEVINNLLLWVHLIGLGFGGAAAFGMPVVGRQLTGATPQARPVLFAVVHGLSRLGQVGLGLLIVTGLLMIWLKFGGTSGFSWWFSLKMGLVVLLIVGVVLAVRLARRIESGDAAAAALIPRVGAANAVLLLAIVLCAAFAFN
jgi:uncharacterized membrane protein